jgi:MoxR-like ATPase
MSRTIAHYERVEMGGKTVLLPEPAVIPSPAPVARDDLLKYTLAAWLQLGDQAPLNFRLYGPPGAGKNALVYHLAQILEKPLYIINGHQELGPEDIACTATMTSHHTVVYIASPLFAAMYHGRPCLFDEIGKAPTAALDPLASVLDDRRSLTSVLAGIHLQAHPDFLFCAILNQNEEEGLGLPGFIDERTRPAIKVGYPTRPILEQIVRAHLPMVAETWFKLFVELFPEEMSPRTASKLLGYAYRLAVQDHNLQASTRQIKGYLKQAWQQVAAGPEKREVS